MHLVFTIVKTQVLECYYVYPHKKKIRAKDNLCI